jgi:cytosine/adenosine deaminase-related metal-dependent hydrolase
MIVSCRWLLPISTPPIEFGWVEVSDGVIRRFGSGRPPAPARDLGQVALLPGLTNAHTHLELSWMAGRIAASASMDEWMRQLLALRRQRPAAETGGVQASARRAARAMRASGTVLVGDVSNTLEALDALVEAGLGGRVFYELLGFDVIDPAPFVQAALDRLHHARVALGPAQRAVTLGLSPHAPYSVSPQLLREIARCEPSPMSVHLGESAEEIEFLRTGGGPIRRTLDRLGVWVDHKEALGPDPVSYLRRVGVVRRGLLAVHAVQVGDAGLEQLREAGAIIVTCPRSNTWVGAGAPPISRFYASGVSVAIGTDSLASTPSLSLYDELAELRRLAPDVDAAALLESATRVGAEALGFGDSHGTIAAGKSGLLTVVDIPAGVRDVEEYLVSGVDASAVGPLAS